MSEITQAVETEHIEKQPVLEKSYEVIKSCSDERLPKPLVDYLVGKRNLPMDTVVDLYNLGQIGYDKHKSKPCVIFKFSDLNDEKHARQYRSMDDSFFQGINKKVKFGKGEKSTGKFFMAGDRLNYKTVVFCEAPINAMSIAGTSPNVLAIATGSAGHTHKLKLLLQYLNSNIDIVCFFDNDISGQSATQETAKVFDRPVKSIRWQEGTPEGYDPNDLLKANNQEQIRAMIAKAVIVERTRPVVENNGWEPPFLFDDVQAPDIPLDLFPSILPDFINNVAEVTRTPPELTMGTLLPIIGAAIGGKTVIEMQPGWVEPINFYTMMAAISGSGKSPVFGYCKAPLDRYERKKRTETKRKIAKTIESNKLYEAKIKHLHKDAKNAGHDKLEIIKKDILKLQGKIEQIPTTPQLYSENVTLEKLAMITARQETESMALLSDEGGFFKVMGGMYANGKPVNYDFLLKGYSRTRYKEDRVTRDPIDIDHPVLNVGFLAQPEIIKKLSGVDEYKHTGLLGRFMYFVPNYSVEDFGRGGALLDKKISDAYNSDITNIIDIKCSTNSEGIIPNVLTLSNETKELWLDNRMVLEKRMFPGNDLEYMQEYCAKASSMTLKVAGLLHVFENKVGGARIITPEMLQRAIDLMEFITTHSMVAMNIMQADQQTQNAQIMWGWIQKNVLGKGKTVFSWDDIRNGTKRKINPAPIQRQAFSALIDRCCVRNATDKTYEINPALHVKNNQPR